MCIKLAYTLQITLNSRFATIIAKG